MRAWKWIFGVTALFAVSGYGVLANPAHQYGIDMVFSQPKLSMQMMPISDVSSLAQGFSNIHNADSGDEDSGPRGPQHTLGPIRHLPLGVQILLGAALFPIGAYIAGKALFDLTNGREATIEACLLMIAVGCVAGYFGLVILMGALVAF